MKKKTTTEWRGNDGDPAARLAARELAGVTAAVAVPVGDSDDAWRGRRMLMKKRTTTRKTKQKKERRRIR